MEDSKKLETLDLIIKKGVAVGMIQLLLEKNIGGVKEYNDFIGGAKKLHLTQDDFNQIANLLTFY